MLQARFLPRIATTARQVQTSIPCHECGTPVLAVKL